MYEMFDEMYDLSNHKKADTIKWIIYGVVIALIIVGLVITMVKVFAPNDGDVLGASAFEIGTIDAEGKEERNTGFIRSKEFISVDGLSVDIQKDANIKYKLVYYTETVDGEPEYLSTTEFLTADLDKATIPATAKLVKIVIQPIGDAEVSNSELREYVSELTVTVGK